MAVIYQILRIFLEALTISIFLRSVLSWIMPGQANAFTDIIYHVTEPILRPIRRILPRMGYVDLSPFVAIVLLQIIIFFVPKTGVST